MQFLDSNISTMLWYPLNSDNVYVSCIMYSDITLVPIEQNLRPSKELDGFLKRRNLDDGLDYATISKICKEYDLDKIDVLKYRDLP